MHSTTMQSNQAKLESGAPLDLAGTWELSDETRGTSFHAQAAHCMTLFPARKSTTQEIAFLT